MFLGGCIALVAIISFNIGKINALRQIPLKISDGANIYKALSNFPAENLGGQAATSKPQPTDLRVVVSKKSSFKKYHFSWCSGAKRIKQENQIWFNSAQEAVSGGYSLAGNCTP